jgi:hypothetical protein
VETAPKVGDYMVVSYLKTDPAKIAPYLEVWKKYSLPLQEDRVKAGKLKSYSMWTVAGGTGTDLQYNIVSLARYASFGDLAPADDPATVQDPVAERVHAGKDWRQMRRDMVSLRTIYRTEIVKIKMTVR